VVTGLSALASAIVSFLGFFLILTILIAFVAAGGIAEAAFRAINRRRGRYTGQAGAAGAVVGGILGGAIHAYIDYPEELGQAVDQARAMGIEVPSEFTQMGYVFDNTLTLPVILFTGITAYLVYTRMKS